MESPGNKPALIAAALFAASALWHAVLAVQHYRAALAITDDPSIRELEQVSALLEAGLCLFLMVHAVLLLVFSRRPGIHWPLLAVTGLLCAAAVIVAFTGHTLLELPGLYPAAVVAGAALASLALRFNWLSLYTGALAGGTLGILAAVPEIGFPAGLFVVVPVLVYALLGGGLAVVLRRIAGR